MREGDEGLGASDARPAIHPQQCIPSHVILSAAKNLRVASRFFAALRMTGAECHLQLAPSLVVDLQPASLAIRYQDTVLLGVERNPGGEREPADGCLVWHVM